LIFCEWVFGIIFLLEVVLNVRAMEMDKFVDTLVKVPIEFIVLEFLDAFCMTSFLDPAGI